MSQELVFISHASKDDDFVRELRVALEGQALTVWVDSRELIGGSKLAPEIEQAIEGARQFVVVLSPLRQLPTTRSLLRSEATRPLDASIDMSLLRSEATRPRRFYRHVTPTE